MKILLADKFPETGLAALRDAGCTVVSSPELKDATLTEALAGEQPDVLVVRSTKVQAEQLDASSSLSLVIRAGAGTNTIDVAGAAARGIYVANCPGKNSIAVAELAFAHLLAADRRLIEGAADLEAGRWNKKEYSKARGIFGQTLGLVGLGRIGREMVPRAHAFGMDVVGWSRSLTPEEAEELGIEFAPTPLDVARRADIVSLHVALNDDTHGLVGEEFLAAMKPDALLINTARAEVVDQKALVWHVEERGLRAALDVFDGEPSGGSGDLDPALFLLNGIQGSHHVGASTEQAQAAVAEETIRIIRSFQDDGVVPNCVNLESTPPASHLLVVRHRDQVGVLAGVLDVLRRAGINVQEVENVIFLGGEAASARIQLESGPDDDTLDAIRTSSEHVLAVSLAEIG